MKKQGRVSSAVMFLLLFCAACSSEQSLNMADFVNVSSAARAVKESVDSGASYERFGETLQGLSNEIHILKARVRAKKGLELLNEYETLLGIYEDGHTLWKYKLEFAPFGIVPKGRIYVSQDVDPIAFRYSFPTESHLYKPTQQYWKSISDDSISVIWRNADFQMKIIEGSLNSP